MLVFATSMRGGLAYPSDGWVLPQGRAAAMPPLTPPHSNWPLFFVPLPSLHADQDNDDIAPAMQRPTSFQFNPLVKSGCYLHFTEVFLIQFLRERGKALGNRRMSSNKEEASFLNIFPQEGITMSTTTEKMMARGNSTSGAPPWCPVLEQDSKVITIWFPPTNLLSGAGCDGTSGALGRTAKDERAGRGRDPGSEGVN